MKLGCIVSFT